MNCTGKYSLGGNSFNYDLGFNTYTQKLKHYDGTPVKLKNNEDFVYATCDLGK